ncbi:MAG TPA: hypothetical protein VM390_12790 [Acidimicrobiales bacterium]|jgi:hypothetical protein|nr:hypothetical protein [Acidimicrobiales bacterium]
MRGRVGRRGVVTAVVAALALALGATAFACTNLATMTLSAPAGHPGDTITLVGTSFPVPRAASTASPTPVVLRWKSGDGPVLATVVPDRTGSISATFQVPPSEAGHAVIIGVQRREVVNPENPDAPPVVLDEPGTPARATFRVLAPGEAAPPARTPVSLAATSSETTGLFVLMVLFGAVSLSLFVGGVMAFMHQVRSRRVMAPVPWPPREW